VGGVTHQQATVAGAITYADGGDYFLLGNLTAGTAINLSESQPSAGGTNTLSAVLTVFKGTTAVATSAAGAASFSYAIPSGGDGNPLAVPFVRTSSLAGVSPYVLETRSNNTCATATPLAAAVSGGDGSFIQGPSYSVGSNPYHLAAADLNADGLIDLVIPNV